MSLVLNFVGIGNGHAPEQNSFAIGINKNISLHPDARQLVCLRAVEQPAKRLVLPPAVISIGLSCGLGVAIRKAEQSKAKPGKEAQCGFHGRRQYYLRVVCGKSSKIATCGQTASLQKKGLCSFSSATVVSGP